MFKVELLAGVVTFALWAYCLVDVIASPGHRVRNLPKVAWLLLVLLFPVVGSVAWLAAGRPRGRQERRSPHGRQQPVVQKDEEFLRRVRERAEEQRRRYEQSRRQAGEPGEPTDPEPAGT